jgi:Kyakuja-Dileera-Zisupton transposase
MDILPRSLGLGYDIACSFSGTITRSSLGPKAHAHRLRMVVPAFHGHAHNRLCQLGFHILMSPGFGLEDLETCERVFSGSNAVARLTRHATSFHRRQFIDMYFHQWDADKYENLGYFLLNNYRQALEVLRDMPTRIETLLSGRQVTDTQFAHWLEAERQYLNSRQSEPERDTLSLEYVELLDKYQHARYVSSSDFRFWN